jgi:ATP phosphoribosyltransferase
MLTYNISVDKLEQACAVTPGKRSPTITGLDDPNFKSVSSLVLKSELNIKMDQLHEVGATDILAINISNSRM